MIPSIVRRGVQPLWWVRSKRDRARANSRTPGFGAAALIAGLLLLVTSCQAKSQYFKELKIDSSLHLILDGDISLSGFQEPNLASYYLPFHGAWITSVDHFERKPGAPARQLSLYLETDQNQVLDRTVKTDELLNGPFGRVNAIRECFYTRPIKTSFGSVSVQFNSKEVGHELPSEVTDPKGDLPEMTSLSLIRTFRTGVGYVVVSANYERDGGLGSLNDGAGTSIYRTPDPQVNDLVRKELAPTLAKYGIPTHIDVQKYVFSRQIPLPDVAFTQDRNVMNEFYGFGKLIRQDELKDGAVVASRWLQPSVTEEEKETLNALCDARFRQQQAIGLPTVE